jgi:hypothetical protein
VHPNLIALLVLIGTLLVGLASTVLQIRQINQQRKTIVEFNNKFVEFANADEFDDEAYIWLVQTTPKIEQILGRHARMEYRPPFQSYVRTNYPVIPNFLAEVRRAKLASGLSSSTRTTQYREHVSTVVEVLLRYDGILEGYSDDLSRWLKNPIMWFREGVRAILALPFSILNSFGLISDRMTHRITQGGVYGVISGIVALVGFVSAIMGIVLGWEGFMRILSGWWQNFPR